VTSLAAVGPHLQPNIGVGVVVSAGGVVVMSIGDNYNDASGDLVESSFLICKHLLSLIGWGVSEERDKCLSMYYVVGRGPDGTPRWR